MARDIGHYWVRTKCNESFIAEWNGSCFISDGCGYNENEFVEISEGQIQLSKSARQLEDIRILMERTGESRLHCNKALFSSDYDINKAEVLLSHNKSK